MFLRLEEEDLSDPGETVQQSLDLVLEGVPRFFLSQSGREFFNAGSNLLIHSFFIVFLELLDFLVVVILEIYVLLLDKVVLLNQLLILLKQLVILFPFLSQLSP